MKVDKKVMMVKFYICQNAGEVNISKTPDQKMLSLEIVENGQKL